MNCPVCKTVLSVADRQGIEIDFCPTCRGVWLDRGELDKILERSASQMGIQQAPVQQPQQPQRPPQPQVGISTSSFQNEVYRKPYDDDDDDRYKYAQKHHGYHKPKKREHWLSDVFDFD